MASESGATVTQMAHATFQPTWLATTVSPALCLPAVIRDNVPMVPRNITPASSTEPATIRGNQSGIRVWSARRRKIRRIGRHAILAMSVSRARSMTIGNGRMVVTQDIVRPMVPAPEQSHPTAMMGWNARQERSAPAGAPAAAEDNC